MQYDYLVVGAGLYGAVFAHEARKRGKRVLVIEKRNHIAGNVYTANSKDVAYDGAELKYSPMASFSVPAQSGNNSIEVIWHYKGSYS